MPTQFRPMFIALVLFTATTSAGPLQDGTDAFMAGDYQRALMLWRPLAERGAPHAQYNLGLLYAGGLGVEKDARSALEWYRKAAESGHADAQFNLGLMYATAQGVFRSDRDAVRWWQLAASRDQPAALYNLALMYVYGRGVVTDPALAATLLQRSATLGYPAAAEVLSDPGAMSSLGLAADPAQGPDTPTDLP